MNAVADIVLPSRGGGEELNKIPAGENILVIKTPKGMYIRTKKGRIYAVHSGHQANMSTSAAAWQSEPPTMSSFQQPSSQSLYTADTTRSLMDPWNNVNSSFDMHNCMPYNSSPTATPMPNGNPYMPPSLPVQRGFASSDISTSLADDVCNVDPMSFLNTMPSYDGNSAWSSPVAEQNVGSLMSDGVDYGMDPLISGMHQQQQLYRDSPRSTVHVTQQQSSSLADLPSDLLCIDTTSLATSSALPALTVRDHPTDADSLDSLTFDGCESFVENSSSANMDPLLDSCHSTLYSTDSNVNYTATSSLSGATAAGADALDVADSADTADEWSEWFAVMNETG